MAAVQTAATASGLLPQRIQAKPAIPPTCPSLYPVLERSATFGTCKSRKPAPSCAHLPLAVLAVLEPVQHGAALAQLHHQVRGHVVLKHVLQQV